VISARATSVLSAQSNDRTQIEALQAQAQDVALDGMAFLATGEVAQLTAMRAGEGAVQSGLVRVAALPTLSASERPGLAGAEQAWAGSLIARNQVETLSPTLNNDVDRSSLAFYFSYVISDVSSQLESALQASSADVASIEQEQQNAQTAWEAAILAALLVSVVWAAWTSRRLTRSIVPPLSLLRDASQRLAAGDLAHRVDIDRDDEVGEVARGFNLMADELLGQRDAILQRERRLMALMEKSSDSILILDAGGRVTFSTTSFHTEYLETSEATSMVTRSSTPRTRSWRAAAGRGS